MNFRQNRYFHDLFTWLTLYPKNLFRNCLHLRLTVWTQPPKIIILALTCAIKKKIFSRLVDIESPLTHSNTSRSGTTSANVKSSLPTLISRSTSGLCLLMVNTLRSTSQCSRRLSPSPSWYLTLSGLVRECSVSRCASGTLPDQLLLDHLVSLGPWCILLRLATLHPSQLARGRIFFRIFNEGYNFTVHVSSTMASLMLSRHHSLFLESLPAGCARGYASFVHRESSVSPQHALPRAGWCSSAAHTSSAAARVRRCLQSSTALVVVFANDFMNLVFTNTAPTQHPSSCSSHVRSSSTTFVHCRISPGFA